MSPLPDELLHSWLYRVQAKYGVFKVDNLVGNKGHWLSFPKLPKNNIAIFAPLNEQAILAGLAYIGALAKTNHMFFEPHSNHEYTFQFIRDGKKSTASSWFTQPLRYCIKCIGTFLENNGYGYFKNSWYFHNFCEIHNSYLASPVELTRRTAFDEISKILSGVHSSKYVFCDQNEIVSQHSGVNELIKDYIAPCLELTFKDFILQLYPELLKLGLRQGSFSNYYGTSCLVTLQNSFLKILNNDPVAWQNFLEKNAKSLEVRNGLIDPGSFMVNVHKLKGSDCDSCTSIYCSFRSSTDKL